MQSKGAIRFVAILLALACIWQLMFTVVTKIHENKAVKYAENAAEAFMASPAYEKIPDVWIPSLRRKCISALLSMT